MKPRPPVLYIGRIAAKDAKLKVEALSKRYQLLCADSAKAAHGLMDQIRPDVIIWDAASLRTHGDRALKRFREELPSAALIRILPTGEKGTSGLANVTLHAPITPRKLINQIEKLLQQPTDEVLSAGPFSMQIQRRLLTVNGHEIQLNPKLTALFEVFLRRPNTTLDRATLMSVVWQTDYVGDTRTLDVHISKVRDVLKNAGANEMLRTVRGVGYRLEVPSLNGRR